MLEDLKALLDIAEEDYSKDRKLTLLLKKAETQVLNYCNLSALPDALSGIVLDLAVVYYNRSGLEGLISQSQGGISASVMDGIPREIKDNLNRYRRLWNSD
jgi:hypothetical protein